MERERGNALREMSKRRRGPGCEQLGCKMVRDTGGSEHWLTSDYADFLLEREGQPPQEGRVGEGF